MTIAATPRQGTEPHVGAITITWPLAPGADGGDRGPRPVTISPSSYDLFFWGTETPVTRFGFAAAGGSIPAFPAVDVDVPQLFEITHFNGDPVAPGPPPSVPRAASLLVTWTGGTGDAVLALQQRQPGSDNDLRVVCRGAVSAGSYTFSSEVIGALQPGDVTLVSSAVSSAMVAAGDYATTLAIAAPLPWHFPFTIE